MKISILPILIICWFISSFPQTISVKVRNLEETKAILFSLQGEKLSTVDTISSVRHGEFLFSLKDKHPGFYRVQFSKTKSLDFLYDGDDIVLETDTKNIFDSLRVVKSESNKIYYDFVKMNRAYKTKTELLQLILSRYPEDDDYYQNTKEKLVQVQEDYLNFVNLTSQVISNSFIARYVRSSQLPVVDIEIPFDKQLVYLKTHALANVNFYDSDLIYSDAFTNKTIEYLTYYRNPQLPLELLEKEFNSAVDSILNKAKVNTIVYQHVVEYLLDGFKKFGFDHVLNYIVENYVIKDELCLDQTLTKALDKRIEQSKRFKVGTVVPNIVGKGARDRMIELQKLDVEKVLIIFYASWCPHCKTLLPQVYKVYKEQKEKKFEVIAISIDTSKTDWQDFVKNEGLNDWIN
ncbi:MAG: AhpC/TSA family protein, partial [Ignavibacteriaceae bacterium]|nr:AhpC/TSA family protein [Ignavibacteriaceae bacterium]